MLQEDIEAEVKACYEVLKGQGVGMTEPLVDAEGDYKGVNIPTFSCETNKNPVCQIVVSWGRLSPI